MTGQASTHGLDAPNERVLPFSLDSCIRIFVSSGQSEGIAPWPTNADEGLPRLSALSVLALCQVPTQSVITFNTADMGGGHLRLDEEHQLLEDARAYLQCMAQEVAPGSLHRGAWETFFFFPDKGKRTMTIYLYGNGVYSDPAAKSLGWQARGPPRVRIILRIFFCYFCEIANIASFFSSRRAFVPSAQQH